MPPLFVPGGAIAGKVENDAATKRLRRVAWAQAWQQPGQMVPWVLALAVLPLPFALQGRIIFGVGALMGLAPLYSLKGGDGGDDKPEAMTLQGLWRSLGESPGRKRRLLACSACWFCSDFYSYGVRVLLLAR